MYWDSLSRKVHFYLHDKSPGAGSFFDNDANYSTNDKRVSDRG